MTLREALLEVVSGLRTKILEGATKNRYCGIKEQPQTDPDHLLWMVDQVIANVDTWPTDKSSRWIGFIQGVLAAKGWMDVKEERDRTRPLFHAAYQSEGLQVPETVGKE